MSKERRWWLGTAAIVVIAAGFRFINFRLGLPYYYDGDEPWFFYQAAWQRGLIPYWIPPNPSQSLIAMYRLAQVISETLTHQSAVMHVPEIFTVMRFISVLLSLATIIFIGLCARELVDERAGWLAAATWAIIPLVIYHSFIAIAEPWMMLCAAVALYAAAVALRRNSTRWALVSVWAGLIGFTFKYSMFPFAGLGLVVALWQLWVRPAQRRRWSRLVVIQIVSVVVFLAFMVLVGGLLGDINNRQHEVAVFFKQPLSRFNNLGDVANILGVAFFQFGIAPLIFGIGFLATLVLYVRQNASIRKALVDSRVASWVLFGALGSFVALLVPTYLVYEGTLGRYMFSATLIFSILAACSFVTILDCLRTRIVLRKWQRRLSLAAVVVVVVWLTPLLTTSVNQLIQFSKPYTLTDLTVWASNTLGTGGVVAEGLANRAFDREWGGYQGDKRLLTFETPFMDKTPQEWEQEGYRYVEIVSEDATEIAATPAGKAYIDQLQELRRFPPTESTQSWAGAPFIVYQLHRPQATSDIAFGDALHLVGYDGLPSSVAAGSTLSLTFYWRASKPPTDNYSLYLHLFADDSTLIAHADGAPGPVGRPTLTWLLPSETLVSEPFTLQIPKDTPAGQYPLMMGVYQPYSGERLATTQGTEVLLATVNIEDTH